MCSIGFWGTAATPPETESVSVEAVSAEASKQAFDALGAAIRAGVDPQDAATRLGMRGLKFTGATPVSLRLPAEEAAALEER